MKHFILIILIFIVSNRISGQTPEYYIPTGGTTYTSSTASDQWYQNLEKYWYYRYKLVNDFLIMGPSEGMSTPVYRRDLGDWYGTEAGN